MLCDVQVLKDELLLLIWGNVQVLDVKLKIYLKIIVAIVVIILYHPFAWVFSL